jgi:hypothetical protein
MRIVLVTPGVFTDAGGFIVYMGSDGKLHVKRVPGWDPGVRAEIGAAVQILDQLHAVKDANVAQRFTEFATGILNARAGEIEHQVGVER